MNTFVSVIVHVIHVFVCFVLMFVVLLQQGKGGGMGSAFGGASAQVFGGSGAGNLLTRATAICAGIFMLTSVSLAHMSSDTDRGLRARETQEQGKKKDKGTLRDKESTPAAPPGASSASPPGAGAPAPTTPAASGTEAPKP